MDEPQTEWMGEGGKIELELDTTGGETKSLDSEKMAQYTNTNLNINVYCEYEVHGFLDGDQKNPASLLVLQFQLGNETTGRRFTAFRPCLTFRSANPKTDLHKQPWTTSLAYPGVATSAFYELSAEASEELTKSISAALKGPDPSPVELALALSKVSGEHYTKKYKYMVKASLSEDDPGRRGKDNQIRWEAWQEEKAQVGIDVIQVAFVVRRYPEYDLQVSIEFDSDVDFRYKVGQKWDEYTKRKGVERTYRFQVYDGTEAVNGKERPKLRATTVPPGVDRNHLRRLETDSRGVFELLGWVHVVESQAPKKYYAGQVSKEEADGVGPATAGQPGPSPSAAGQGAANQK